MITEIRAFAKERLRVLHLSPGEYLLESYIFCIGPSEIVELGCEINSQIAPMPWLDFIVVDSYSFLIALSPSVEMSVLLQPSDITPIVEVLEIFSLGRRIEEIHRESELVFARARRCTQRVTTLSEIPHSLLVFRTSVGTDYRDWDSEFRFEIRCHIPESISSDFPELQCWSSSSIDICSTDRFEIIWFIVLVRERRISTHESVDTLIYEEWESTIFLMDIGKRKDHLRSRERRMNHSAIKRRWANLSSG